MVEFTALQDFFSPELQSHYVRGMSYTVRPPEHYDEENVAARKRCALLAKLWPKWLDEQKIVLGRAAPVRVNGQGE